MNEQQNNSQQPQENKPENLIHLSEKQIVSAMPDLNARLRDIESELKHLNAREAATNKSFLELSSETRKSLGGQNTRLDETQSKMSELSGQYRKISQDYQRVAAASNLLSAQLERAREEIDEKIDSVDVAATRKTHDLEVSLNQLIERAGHIEQRATQLSTDMQSRFDVMQTTMQAVESRLMQEVREVAEQSEQRDEALSIRMERHEEETAGHLEHLRETDTSIQQDLDQLSGQVDVVEARLNDNISRLDEAAEDLSFQTNILDARTEELETFAEKTEERVNRHGMKLREIARRVERHHIGFAIALVLIAVTLAVVGFTQQSRWHEMLNTEQQLEAAIASQADVQQAQASQIASLSTLEDSVLGKVDERQITLTDEMASQNRKLDDLQQSLKAIEAQQQNEASRLSALVPGRSFGLDNTIHNAEWLATQDKAHFVIDVITVKDKQELYDAAFRWASLLNQSHLSYIEQNIDGQVFYTLIYGTFENQSEAEKISRYMPVVSFDNRPTVMRLGDLL